MADMGPLKNGNARPVVRSFNDASQQVSAGAVVKNDFFEGNHQAARIASRTQIA
jgi:hypothetical protein